MEGVELMSKWISVKERLPELYRKVLLFRSNDIQEDEIWTGHYSKFEETYYWRSDMIGDPTHWMPLPEPPK